MRSLSLLALTVACVAAPAAATDRDFGISNQNNIAAMAVDLTPSYAGVKLEGSNGTVVDAAANRYRKGQVMPLLPLSGRGGRGGGGGGGGGGWGRGGWRGAHRRGGGDRHPARDQSAVAVLPAEAEAGADDAREDQDRLGVLRQRAGPGILPQPRQGGGHRRVDLLPGRRAQALGRQHRESSGAEREGGRVTSGPQVRRHRRAPWRLPQGTIAIRPGGRNRRGRIPGLAPAPRAG
jgi:hypothetical protein